MMNGPSLTQAQMTTLAQNQANKLRVARQMFQPIIGQGYTDSVLGHRVIKGPTMSVRLNQHLPALQISRHFLLQKEQSSDTTALNTLIGFAAADIAQAEDAVILLGAEAAPLLQRLHIILDNPDELDQQEGLFHKNQPNVGQPILDSILEGIKALRGRGQSGEYYVIVSPDLYEEAHKSRVSPVDAPIYQIQPLLANHGFLFSEAVPAKKGIILSLARNTISLSVPMDTYVDSSLPNDEAGRPRFAVAEQFRLVIDDPDARTDLK